MSENQIEEPLSIEAQKLQLAKQYKAFIQKNSNEYLERLKEEITKGFRNYFQSLNQQLIKEQQELLDKEKTVQNEFDEHNEGQLKAAGILNRRNQILLQEKENKYNTFLKLKAFLSLKKNRLIEKEDQKEWNLIDKISTHNKKRNIFKALKSVSLFQKNKDYSDKLKVRSNLEITKIKNNLDTQKQQIYLLIKQAQERLKHENRKKIQSKLLLDQMVLRGISGLNMQAMKLSQSSLKDVVNCDYKREIDKKYHEMLFPESKETFINSMK